MATFVDAVNRILRKRGILRGDDDNIADFTSTQHAASIESAKIAIQDELAWLSECEDVDLPYERTTGTVTAVTSTRTYAIASDFLRLTAERKLWEVDASGNAENTFIAEVEESYLRDKINAEYESTPGEPVYFYFTEGTTNQVGLYPVPDESGQVYKYWYDKTTDVTTSTDTMPFITERQFYAFCSAAERVFEYLRLAPPERDRLFPSGIEQDTVLESKRARLLAQLNRSKRNFKYGRRYA